MGTDEALESELGLGELAGLTVANEAENLSYDVSPDNLTNISALETKYTLTEIKYKIVAKNLLVAKATFLSFLFKVEVQKLLKLKNTI